MARTIEEIMLDAINRANGVDEASIRAVVSALAYVAESAIRSDQIFVLFEVLLGGNSADRQMLVDWPTSGAGHLSEMDGRELQRQLVEAGSPMSSRGIVTFSDMHPLIDHHSRQLLPELSDDTIDRVVLAATAALSEALNRQERLDLGPKAAERVVEDWIVDHLGQFAERCELPDLELVRHQYRFSDRTRADLLCRSTTRKGAFPEGLWVVIELKAGLLLPIDVDQIAGYVAAVERELDHTGRGVLGVLVGDGWDPAVLDRIEERDVAVICQNLVSIGFHTALFESTRAIERGE